MTEQSKLFDRRLLIGVIFVAIGAIWLLDSINILPYYFPDYLISWKTFLILLGLYFLIERKSTVTGAILVMIGGIFLLRDLHYFYFFDVWHVLWPAVIIIIGLALILRRRSDAGLKGVSGDSVDVIDVLTIFSGREIKIDSQEFRGGKTTTMFGGTDLDLRGADLSKDHNVLDTLTIFGGTDIIVPADWTVKIDVNPVFGGFKDARISYPEVVPNPDKVLIIKGFVMFGGGELKLA